MQFGKHYASCIVRMPMNLKLDTALQFNINSASHANSNAVLGQIVLSFILHNVDGDNK